MSRRETESKGWRRGGCESSACAEVKWDDGDVLIRSSLAPGDVVRLTGDEWVVFRTAVAAGDFDEE